MNPAALIAAWTTPAQFSAEAKPCLTPLFPFVGKAEPVVSANGLMQYAVSGDHTSDYTGCSPLFMQSEGFDFLTPLVRIALTGAIVWFLVKD